MVKAGHRLSHKGMLKVFIPEFVHFNRTSRKLYNRIVDPSVVLLCCSARVNHVGSKLLFRHNFLTIVGHSNVNPDKKSRIK